MRNSSLQYLALARSACITAMKICQLLWALAHVALASLNLRKTAVHNVMYPCSN